MTLLQQAMQEAEHSINYERTPYRTAYKTAFETIKAEYEKEKLRLTGYTAHVFLGKIELLTDLINSIK